MTQAKQSDMKTLALTTLLTVVVAFGGGAYKTMDSRVGILEKERKDVTDVALSVGKLQENVTALKEVVDKMDVKQDKLDTRQAEILTRVNALILGVSKDSRRWNEIMDDFNRKNYR